MTPGWVHIHMTRMTGPDRVVTCNLLNTHTNRGVEGGGGVGVLNSENSGRIRWQSSLIGKALARPPSAPWEKALAKPPKLGKYGIKESNGKVQESAGEGRQGICGMP